MKDRNEAGRYKKKCDELQREIDGLREAVKAHGQIQELNEALIALLLMKLGADTEHPVKIGRDEQTGALSGCSVRVAMDPAGDGYLMSWREK